MSDDWTQQQLREIRHLAPDYGWQGTHKDGDVIRWINSRAPACLDEYKRRAEEAGDANRKSVCDADSEVCVVAGDPYHYY